MRRFALAFAIFLLIAPSVFADTVTWGGQMNAARAGYSVATLTAAC
jgi:hypothetical protein